MYDYFDLYGREGDNSNDCRDDPREIPVTRVRQLPDGSHDSDLFESLKRSGAELVYFSAGNHYHTLRYERKGRTVLEVHRIPHPEAPPAKGRMWFPPETRRRIRNLMNPVLST
jgi:hypothetical protein